MLNPADVVANATIQAKLLMDIVEKTHCFQLIAKKKYLQVEAWETIGAFNQTHAVTESIRPILKENEIIGYEADVKLWKGDMIVGGATMPCFFTENACKGKEGDAKHKASMSAAQTFATSKAYRMNYSYVAILAGYEPTPAEEITGEDTIGGVKLDNKKDHWCAEHNAEFFMKGKMKGYAHQLEDGTWHNEPEPVKSPPPPPPPATEGRAESGDEQKAAPKKAKVEQARDLSLLKNTGDLAKALNADYGLQVSQILKELNIERWTDLAISLKDAYIQVAATRQ